MPHPILERFFESYEHPPFTIAGDEHATQQKILDSFPDRGAVVLELDHVTSKGRFAPFTFSFLNRRRYEGNVSDHADGSIMHRKRIPIQTAADFDAFRRIVSDAEKKFVMKIPAPQLFLTRKYMDDFEPEAKIWLPGWANSPERRAPGLVARTRRNRVVSVEEQRAAHNWIYKKCCLRFIR